MTDRWLDDDPLDEAGTPAAAAYHFGYGVGEHELPSLEAVKTWLDGDDRRFDTFTVAEYGSYDEAGRDEDELNAVLETRGVEAAIQLAEGMAVAGGYLDPERTDGRVFFADDAPADPFTTARERELALTFDPAPEVGERLLDITDDETQELPTATPEPGSWDELIEQERIRAAQPEPERESSYWRLDTCPLESPEGEAQGYGLFITVFPELPADLDRYLEENGIDDAISPTHARRLEIAHFETDWAAEKYAQEFRGYLIPGLLDGPELAEEAAKLEGMPGTWEEMDYRDIIDDMSSHRSVARATDERHVHVPNAARDARIAAEEINTDLSYQPITLEQGDDGTKFEATTPDFDL